MRISMYATGWIIIPDEGELLPLIPREKRGKLFSYYICLDDIVLISVCQIEISNEYISKLIRNDYQNTKIRLQDNLNQFIVFPYSRDSQDRYIKKYAK